MKNTIEKIREAIGMSRKEFAEAVGTTRGAISNYELGLRYPNHKIAYRICDLANQYGINIKLEDIYPREDS